MSAMRTTSSDTHDCPGGCGLQVPDRLFAEAVCWFRLPHRIRAAIVRAYRFRGREPMAHLRAMGEARTWFRNHPMGAPR